MMGMFVIGSLIQRWVSITFTPVVSTVKQQEGAYIDWDKLPKGIAGVKEAFHQQAAGRSLDVNKVTTLQDNLNQLIPGLAALGLTFLCMYLLKRKVSPIVIILEQNLPTALLLLSSFYVSMNGSSERNPR